MRDYGTLCPKWITSSNSSTRHTEGYMVEEERECKCEVITLRKEWFPGTIGLTYLRTHRFYYTDPENIYSRVPRAVQYRIPGYWFIIYDLILWVFLFCFVFLVVFLTPLPLTVVLDLFSRTLQGQENIWLCICIFFHQLQDDTALMTVGLSTNLFTGDGHFRLHICYWEKCKIGSSVYIPGIFPCPILSLKKKKKITVLQFPVPDRLGTKEGSGRAHILPWKREMEEI